MRVSCTHHGHRQFRLGFRIDVLLVGAIIAFWLTCAAGNSSAAATIYPSGKPIQPAAIALIYVPLPSPERLDEALRAGLSSYRRYGGLDDGWLLAGVHLPPGHIGPDLRFPFRVLDADISGATYYFVTLSPGQPQLDWPAFGEVLVDEDHQILIRATAIDAERMVEQGAAIAQVELTPVVRRSGPVGSTDAAAPQMSSNPMIQEMIDQVSSAQVYNYVAQLSGAAIATVGGAPYTFQTRSTTSGTPINKATQYAYEHLAALGYSAQYVSWSKSGLSGRNVVAELPGQSNPGDIYYIGAHIDSYTGGSAAPGADDNATGSAAALMAAEILGQYQWGCTLRIGLWTGEEQGELGSDVYATNLKTAGANVRGYLNMDMLGWDTQTPRKLDLFATSAVNGSVAMADLFTNVISTYALNLTATKYIDDALFQQSDNYSFSRQGYPAILVIEDYKGYNNPYIHTTGDSLSQIDQAYLGDMVKAAVGTFATMTGCLIPDAPTTTKLALQGTSHTDVDLSWYQTYPNANYEVLRGSDPFFDPNDAGAELIGTRSAPNLGVQVNYIDTGAAGNPDANHYYVIRGFSSAGGVASTSQRIGEFAFALTPGTAQ
jgi:hypothetical protein